MTDLISRQATIEAISALDSSPNAWLESAAEAIRTLPSIEPKRQAGKCEVPRIFRQLKKGEQDENCN